MDRDLTSPSERDVETDTVRDPDSPSESERTMNTDREREGYVPSTSEEPESGPDSLNFNILRRLLILILLSGLAFNLALTF